MYSKAFVATVLTVYGIETATVDFFNGTIIFYVATVLTVYGIETSTPMVLKILMLCSLQQYLPFTVLKPFGVQSSYAYEIAEVLQQYLPFTVLKQTIVFKIWRRRLMLSCNSTYRLRY